MPMDQAHNKLIKARTGLLLEHPFFGSLCLRMNPVADAKCATAWTDGKTLAYNPVYVNSLTQAQVQGLMAHTVMHPACQHHVRRKDRDSNTWNAACDHAINWILLDAGITLPPNYLDNPAYHGLTADEIYSELYSRGGDETRFALSDGGGKVEGDVQWDGLPGSIGEGEDLGDESDTGAGEAGKDGQMDDGGSAGDDQDEAVNEQHGDPGGSGEVRDSAQELEGGSSDEGGNDDEWELALAQAAQQAREMGDIPGSLERLIKQVLNPELDWQELLDRYISERARDDYSWTPPNKRFLHLDIVLPSLSHRKLPELVLAIDTSGSVSEAEMNRFGAEMSGILEAYDTTLRVVYCDSAVTGTQIFGRCDLPLDLSPKGGGGTDYRPVFDWVGMEHLDPACLVYLTDLECNRFPEGEPGYPVLWVRVGGGNQLVPFGHIIEM